MHKFDYTVSAQFRTSAWLYSCKLCMLWNDPGDTTLAKGSKDSMVLQSNLNLISSKLYYTKLIMRWETLLTHNQNAGIKVGTILCMR